MKFAVLFLFLIFLVSACVHLPMEQGYQGPNPLPGWLEEEYACQPYRGTCQTSSIKTRRRFSVHRVTLSPGTARVPGKKEIILDYYAPDKEKKIPVIMVLPIFGGSNAVAEIFASFFAENGYAAVVVHRQKQYKKLEAFEKIDSVLRQMVFDHRQVLDWIETREELDTFNTGIFGISMGAVKAALVTAVDRRIKAGVFALAGGDLPYILARSPEKHIHKKRQRYMEKNHLTQKQLYSKLKREISCDPLPYAGYIDAEKVLMILALWDRIVPIEKGKELKRRMGNPETIYLLSGHYSAILYIHYVKQKVLDFFDDHLKEKPHPFQTKRPSPPSPPLR